MNLFRKESPKEVLRKQQRELRSVERGIERDSVQLGRQEKQIELDIKKTAKAGHLTQCKTLAKQLVHLRKQRDKLLLAKTQLRSVGLKNQQMNSNLTIAQSMQGATKVMTMANKTNNIQTLQKDMMQFDRQNQEFDLKEEMMNDTIDAVMDEAKSDEEDESEQILKAIFDEIGVEVNAALPSPGMSILETATNKVGTSFDVDTEAEDILKRLSALKST